MARFTKPSTSVFSYYKRPKTGAGEGLRTRQHTNRARLTVCELGIFSREISQLLKICPPPALRSHLNSSPTGIFSRDQGISCFTSVPRSKPKIELTGSKIWLCYFVHYSLCWWLDFCASDVSVHTTLTAHVYSVVHLFTYQTVKRWPMKGGICRQHALGVWGSCSTAGGPGVGCTAYWVSLIRHNPTVRCLGEENNVLAAWV